MGFGCVAALLVGSPQQASSHVRREPLGWCRHPQQSDVPTIVDAANILFERVPEAMESETYAPSLRSRRRCRRAARCRPSTTSEPPWRAAPSGGAARARWPRWRPRGASRRCVADLGDATTLQTCAREGYGRHRDAGRTIMAPRVSCSRPRPVVDREERWGPTKRGWAIGPQLHRYTHWVSDVAGALCTKGGQSRRQETTSAGSS